MRIRAETIFKLATYLIAAASGAGIFVLQIGWEREISIPMGGDTLAIMTILFAFLIGLGSGGEYFGRLADKTKSPWKQCGSLALLGSASILIVSIFFLPGIFGTIAYSRGSFIFTYLWRFGLSSILIFIPTFFLGGLLPTLLKFLSRFNHAIGTETGRVYALFSLGGVIGTLGSGFIFIPLFGTEGAIIIATTIFAFIATSVWLLKLPHHLEEEKAIQKNNETLNPAQNKTPAAISKTERYLSMFSLALIGAITISLEIIWTRTLGLMIGSSVFGFSIMVATCLVGISAGSYLSSRFIDNLDHTFAWFGAFTVLAGVTAVGSSWFMNELPWWFSRITEITGEITALNYFLKFLTSSIVLLPPMAIIGALFPLSVNIIIKSPLHTGKTVGRTFALYMIGSGLGGLFTSIILIPSIGLRATIAVTTSMLIILGALLLIEQKFRQRKTIYLTQGVLASIFGIINLIAQPPWDPLLLSNSRRSTHGLYPAYDSAWLAHEDGLNASIAVVERENINTRYLIVNGVETLSIPIENGPSESNLKTQKLMGILPIVLNTQEPKSALVLGAGTGKTVSTILKDERVSNVDIIEIEPAMYKMEKFFNTPGNERITRYVGDTRDFLLSKYDRYDLITSSSPTLFHSSISNGVSSEFYRAVSERLTGDGIFCQWIEPGRFSEEEFTAIIRTFRTHFPIIILAEGGSSRDLILIGGRSPLHININQLKEGLKVFSKDEDETFTYSTLLSHLLVGPNGSYKLGLGAQILSDTNPRIEFSTSTINGPKREAEKANLKLTREFVDDEIAKMIQTDSQTDDSKASILAQIAIDSIRNLPARRASIPRAEVIKSYITSSFEEDFTPEALFAYALLTDTDQGEIFKNIMNYKTTSPVSLMIKGELALNLGELKSAKTFFDQAISKEPYLSRAYYLKGITCQQLNRIEEAIAAYKLGAELGNSDAAISLGNLLLTKDNAPEAEKWYKKATTLNPTSWIAWDNLGKIYYEQDKREEAIKAFGYVLLLRPHYPDPHRYLGNIFRDLGQSDLALKHYELYLTHSKDQEHSLEITRSITSIREPKSSNQ